MTTRKITVVSSFWKMLFFLSCILTTISVLSLKVAAAEYDESCYRLPVFQTSDIHGRLVNIDNEKPEYRVAYISDKVKDVRGYGESFSKDKALLLDTGDIYQGYPMSSLSGGQPLSKAFTLMEYDAVTVGNHEFDWGLDTLVDSDATMFDPSYSEIATENKIPVLLSNLYQDDKRVTRTKDYLIFTKTATDGNGNKIPVNIAVIGFAGDYSSSIANKHFSDLGYSIKLDYDSLNALAAELESSGQCDATVLICHEEAKLIAEGVGQDSVIDLVLGGHSHENDSGTTSWGLPYIEPTNMAQSYTYSELVFEKKSDGSAAVAFKGVDKANYVSINQNATHKPENWEDLIKQEGQAYQGDLDPEIVALSDLCIDLMGQQLTEKIGYITETAIKDDFDPDKGYRTSAAGNWVASMHARMVGAQVGFVNHGGVRKSFVVEEGQDHLDIRVEDVYLLFPYENPIYCYEITYEDLLKVFQYGVTSKGATVLSHMVGMYCYYTGRTINAIVTPKGKTIYANGEWYDDWKDKKIRVAVSEYQANSTKKDDGGPSNPFRDWINTDRLISTHTVDAQGALEVLRKEAADQNGLLTIDRHTYYINKEYSDDKTPGSDPTPTPAPTPTPSVTPAPSTSNTPAAQINSGFKVNTKGGKVTVKWGKVSGASFYKIYAAYGNSKKFKLVKKVKSNKKRKLVIKKINGKKINKKKKLKIYVAAYKTSKEKNKKIATSKTAKITSLKKVKYSK